MKEIRRKSEKVRDVRSSPAVKCFSIAEETTMTRTSPAFPDLTSSNIDPYALQNLNEDACE
jgi:hypothetical protein